MLSQITRKKKIGGALIAVIIWVAVNYMPMNMTAVADFPVLEDVQKIEIWVMGEPDEDMLVSYQTTDKKEIQEVYNRIANTKISKQRRGRYDFFTEKDTRIVLYKDKEEKCAIAVTDQRMNAAYSNTNRDFHIWDKDFYSYIRNLK